MVWAVAAVTAAATIGGAIITSKSNKSAAAAANQAQLDAIEAQRTMTPQELAYFNKQMQLVDMQLATIQQQGAAQAAYLQSIQPMINLNTQLWLQEAQAQFPNLNLSTSPTGGVPSFSQASGAVSGVQASDLMAEARAYRSANVLSGAARRDAIDSLVAQGLSRGEAIGQVGAQNRDAMAQYRDMVSQATAARRGATAARVAPSRRAPTATTGASSLSDVAGMIKSAISDFKKGFKLTPEQEKQINDAIQFAKVRVTNDLEAQRADALDAIFNEVAPALGMRSKGWVNENGELEVDTPNLDRAGKISAEYLRQIGSAYADLEAQGAQMKLNVPLQYGAAQRESLTNALTLGLQGSEIEGNLSDAAARRRLNLMNSASANAQNALGLGVNLASVTNPQIQFPRPTVSFSPSVAENTLGQGITAAGSAISDVFK